MMTLAMTKVVMAPAPARAKTALALASRLVLMGPRRIRTPRG